MASLTQQPQLRPLPNLEPPGFDILRDILMRKLISRIASPYGYQGGAGAPSMQSLYTGTGRGLMNPYTGTYGSGPDMGGGGGAPRGDVTPVQNPRPVPTPVPMRDGYTLNNQISQEGNFDGRCSMGHDGYMGNDMPGGPPMPGPGVVSQRGVPSASVRPMARHPHHPSMAGGNPQRAMAMKMILAAMMAKRRAQASGRPPMAGAALMGMDSPYHDQRGPMAPLGMDSPGAVGTLGGPTFPPGQEPSAAPDLGAPAAGVIAQILGGGGGFGGGGFGGILKRRRFPMGMDAVGAPAPTTPVPGAGGNNYGVVHPEWQGALDRAWAARQGNPGWGGAREATDITQPNPASDPSYYSGGNPNPYWVGGGGSGGNTPSPTPSVTNRSAPTLAQGGGRQPMNHDRWWQWSPSGPRPV